MNRVKQLRAAKPIKPSNDDLQTEKPKEPVDLSKLEGVYPLTVVGGLFVKKGNHAEVILGLQFDHPEMNHMRIDVTLKDRKSVV